MLKDFELEALYTVLDSRHNQLHKYCQSFRSACSKLDAPNVPFRMACAIIQFILLNLLTKQQRLVALFMVLDYAVADDVVKSPVTPLLFYLFDKGTSQAERALLHDVLAMNGRDKFAMMELAEIEEQGRKRETVQTSQRFHQLKKQVIDGLPQVENRLMQMPASLAAEIRVVVPDFPNGLGAAQVDQPANSENISVEELAWKGFGTNFLIPLPQYMPIEESELLWLSPGILAEPIWDNSTKIYQQLRSACTAPLTKEQSSALIVLLSSNPCEYAGAYEDFNFAGLFSRNPAVAMHLLATVPPSILNRLYDTLVDLQLTKSNLQSMCRLILQREVPFTTVNYYCIKIMQKCQALTDEVSQDKLARMIISLLKELIKARRLDPKEIEAEIRSFGIRMCQVDEVAKLYKRFAENNSK